MPTFSNGYGYRAPFTADHTQVSGSGTLTDYASFFRITDANLATVANGGVVESSTGDDIRFEDGSGTKLDHELTLPYDPATGTIVGYVRLPADATSDYTGFVFAGNASVVSPEANPSGVWDSDFKGVYHLGNGTILVATDSTANGNDGTVSGASAASGPTGGGADFSSGDYIEIPSSTDFDSTMGTWEFWTTNTASPGDFPGLIARADSGSLSGLVGIIAAYSAGIPLGMEIKDASGSLLYQEGGSAVNDGTPHRVAISFNGAGTATLYQDGAAVVSGTTGSAWSFAGEVVRLGRIPDTGWGPYIGMLSEVRLTHGVERSADWLATDYTTQTSGTFITLGSFSTPAAPGLRVTQCYVEVLTTNAPPTRQQTFSVLLIG